jgi:chromosome segregation ATPase
VSILEEKLKVTVESESRLRAELAAEKKASEDKLSEARAQARSEASDRDARLKDITQQLDQARADVFAAKSEAESFRFLFFVSFIRMKSRLNYALRQANQRLQVELENNTTSFDQKLASASATYAAEREQMRLQIESLDAKLKEQVDFLLHVTVCAMLTRTIRMRSFAPP